MVISHRHPNGPLPGFVWRRPAAVFLFPVALLLRSAVDRVAASAAPAWMADIYLCVYICVCAFDRSFLRPLFAQLDVYADAAVEADSNLFTSPESFPSLWGLLARRDVGVAASLHCLHWGKKTPQWSSGLRASCMCRPVGASCMKIKYVDISGSEAGGVGRKWCGGSRWIQPDWKGMRLRCHCPRLQDNLRWPSVSLVLIPCVSLWC